MALSYSVQDKCSLQLCDVEKCQCGSFFSGKPAPILPPVFYPRCSCHSIQRPTFATCALWEVNVESHPENRLGVHLSCPDDVCESAFSTRPRSLCSWRSSWAKKNDISQTCTLTSICLIVACTFILMILNVIFVHFEGQLFLVFQRRCWERNLPKVTQLVQIIRFQIWWNTKLPEWRISQDHIQITWRACKRIGESWEIPGPSSEPATGPEKDLERESTVNLLGSSSLPPAKFLF